jgi:hypothetical protein
VTGKLLIAIGGLLLGLSLGFFFIRDLSSVLPKSNGTVARIAKAHADLAVFFINVAVNFSFFEFNKGVGDNIANGYEVVIVHGRLDYNMKYLPELIAEASASKVAIGHFNFSTLEGLWAIFEAARELNVPVIAGVSEGERDFVGVRQAVALVKSLREEFNYPIFLNADHTYSFDRVKQAIDAGFDSVIVDGANLSLEENIKLTKQCVGYAKSVNPNIIVEGELGYIGQSSQLLSELPSGAGVASPPLMASLMYVFTFLAISLYFLLKKQALLTFFAILNLASDYIFAT